MASDIDRLEATVARTRHTPRTSNVSFAVTIIGSFTSSADVTLSYKQDTGSVELEFAVRTRVEKHFSRFEPGQSVRTHFGDEEIGDILEKLRKIAVNAAAADGFRGFSLTNLKDMASAFGD